MGLEEGSAPNIEQEAEEYLRKNYPSKRAWVNENLEVLQTIKRRKDFNSDAEVVSWAIETTVDFAKKSGVNNPDARETDVLHIPSRIAAIRKFESAGHPLERQLTLDRVVQIYVIAETVNLQRSVRFASQEKSLKVLENLRNLVGLHKKLTEG